ncbi:serine/threonine protein kinase [Planomonospora parontospora subsp. parontospora]|uniref:Serine/threonine protein kinase n=2 Tax=Planomonospora parontospora TaxID=58119 RepID=A0AA37BDB9_9ACTN|nr:YncE family protein [Planomonospora parontospora]GGK53238.1 serine/threonine protein kinase [Planomonospora parontospora]GII07663.1 serine/threonine protein kinase [Planomonospora parontospora subsp. parontospora]
MVRSRSALHRTLRRLAVSLSAAAVTLAGTNAAWGTARTEPLRDVLLVGNAQAGTVSFIDGRTFQNLGSLDAIPDLEERLAAMNPVERAGYEAVNAAQGYRKFVDDMALSPDGRTLYVSRGNLADVVAFDVRARTILWRHKIEGFKADHAALSPDGTRFVVSALTAAKAVVLDTADGRPVASFPTGTYPHGNDYSPDGTLLYNQSIGVTSLPRAMNLLKGDKRVTVVDARTHRVLRTHRFAYGVRPSVFTADNRYMYAQLSYLNGFIEYDLNAGRTVRTVTMPFSDRARAMSPDAYPQNSAHHGMALSGDERKLCMAGTIDDYVAIVDRPSLSVAGYRHYAADSLPYWTATSVDGQHCFVSLSNQDVVSVIDYATAEEVARIPVGRFPQRERLGAAPQDVLDSLATG